MNGESIVPQPAPAVTDCVGAVRSHVAELPAGLSGVTLAEPQANHTWSLTRFGTQSVGTPSAEAAAGTTARRTAMTVSKRRMTRAPGKGCCSFPLRHAPSEVLLAGCQACTGTPSRSASHLPSVTAWPYQSL